MLVQEALLRMQATCLLRRSITLPIPLHSALGDGCVSCLAVLETEKREERREERRAREDEKERIKEKKKG